jgi:hypothetical protein
MSRYVTADWVALLCLCGLCGCAHAPARQDATAGRAVSGDAVIHGNGIVIRTTSRLAGAIDSLQWNGQEFVDSLDHGRQIQTAWFVNNCGGIYNPTEAGSASDGRGPATTSILLFLSAKGNVLHTRSRPAFWLDPGVYDGCGYFDLTCSTPPWRPGHALNKTKVAESILEKRVTIGYAGIPDVIEYVSSITFTPHELAEFPIRYFILENPAIYMPVAFSTAYRFDPRTSQLTAMPKPAYGYSTTPAILSTEDGKYAMGLYTDEVPWRGFPDSEQKDYAGYEVIDWTRPDQGACMLLGPRIPKTPPTGDVFAPGTYTYRSFLIVGTLEDVEQSMSKLYDLHPAAL